MRKIKGMKLRAKLSDIDKDEVVTIEDIKGFQKLNEQVKHQLEATFDNQADVPLRLFNLEDQNGNEVEEVSFNELTEHFTEKNFYGEPERYIGTGEIAVSIDSIFLAAEDALETLREHYYNQNVA